MRYLAIIIGLTTVLSAFAQDSDGVRVELRDFKQESVTWSDNYPDMNLRGVGSNDSRRWKRLAVQIRLSDRKADRNEDTWIDGLQFHWNVVLALGRNGLDHPRPSSSIRFERTVSYVNIRTDSRGADYWNMVFIPPEVMQRYGRHDDIPDDQIMGRLDIVLGNHHLATIWFEDGKAKMSDRAPSRTIYTYVSGEDPVPHDYGLLIRPETPWSFASSDSEELMRLTPVESQ